MDAATLFQKKGDLVGLPPSGQVAYFTDASGAFKQVDAAGTVTSVGSSAWTADGVTLTGSGTGGSPAAIKVPLTLSDPTPGINKILTLNANVAAGDPAISFKSNGVEVGYVRVDGGGNVNIVPIGAGGTTVLWVNGEASWKFAVGVTGISFFNGTLRAQQNVGALLTDGTSGGTASTLTTFAGTTYTTDAPIIQGNFHQINLKLAALQNALGSTGSNLVSP